MNITCYDPNDPLPEELQQRTAGFLVRHLGRFGDPIDDILKAIAYAMNDAAYAGGFVCLATVDGQIVGAVVVNRTGMESYIPENILVYIAVHSEQRGRGLGLRLMEEALDRAQGGVALHVEADNPARRLYERLGFTNKYLEMRLCRKERS